MSDILFVITVILVIFVHYNHEISLKSYAKPNQLMDVVLYNRELVITVIVITEFDCSILLLSNGLAYLECGYVQFNIKLEPNLRIISIQQLSNVLHNKAFG